MKCSATKNRLSRDRCSLKALKGINFCGRHAKSKSKVIWVPEDTENEPATKIQKIWRGWMVRHFLKLAEHSFDRSGYHNEEELVSLEEKEKQHPMNFFSFLESGKRWWFGLDTIFKLMQEEHPKNPYTNEPFSRGTRKRIRELQDLCWYRRTIKIPQSLHQKAVDLVHILEDETYEPVSYTRFEYMSRTSILSFTENAHQHIEARMLESQTIQRRRHLFVIETCLTKQVTDVHTDFLLFQLLSTLLYILRTTKNKFPLAYIMFGALQQI
jgi:hypothetical protein